MNLIKTKNVDIGAEGEQFEQLRVAAGHEGDLELVLEVFNALDLVLSGRLEIAEGDLSTGDLFLGFRDLIVFDL